MTQPLEAAVMLIDDGDSSLGRGVFIADDAAEVVCDVCLEQLDIERSLGIDESGAAEH